MIYLQNFIKILQHKFYVLLAGLYLNVSLWQLIVHDLSKFSKAEFKPYAKYFLDGKVNKEEFMFAWLNHLSVNKHH